jgi:hypothetical protein
MYKLLNAWIFNAPFGVYAYELCNYFSVLMGTVNANYAVPSPVIYNLSRSNNFRIYEIIVDVKFTSLFLQTTPSPKYKGSLFNQQTESSSCKRSCLHLIWLD